MSFTAAYQTTSTLPIHLVLAKSKGRACYYYIMATEQKAKMIAANKGAIDMSTIGQILQSGYGHTPSRAHQDDMFERFGFPRVSQQ